MTLDIAIGLVWIALGVIAYGKACFRGYDEGAPVHWWQWPGRVVCYALLAFFGIGIVVGFFRCIYLAIAYLVSL